MKRDNVSINEEALSLFIGLPDLFYVNSERVKQLLIGIGISEDKILVKNNDDSTTKNLVYNIKSNGDVEFKDNNQVFWYLDQNASDDEMKQSLIDHGCDEDRANEIVAKDTLLMAYYDFINSHNMELSLTKSQYPFLYMYNKYGAQWMFHYKYLTGYSGIQDVEK